MKTPTTSYARDVGNNSSKILFIQLSYKVKKFIIVFILIIISKVKLFSQDSLSGSNDYKSVLQISCLNLIIKDITVDYSYFISKKHYIEISLGYRFNSENADYKIGFIKFEDPFWLYNQISTRIGFGNYFSESFYITPMVLFNYSYFDRKYFNVYEDYEGDLYDKDYV